MITLMKSSKSLKHRLSFYFTIITIVPSLLITLFYYYYSTNSLKKTMVDNATTNTAYIMSNIDNQLKLAMKLSDWTFLNKTLEKVLVNSRLTDLELYDEIINNKQILDTTLVNSPIAKNISCILIEGNNGVDIRYGDDASLINKAELKAKPWFVDSLGKGDAIYLPGIVENPNVIKHDSYIIPIARPIVHSIYNVNIGWSLIAFKESLISDVFNDFNVNDGKSLYVIDKDGICISSTERSLIGKSMFGEKFIQNILHSEQNGNFNANIGGVDKLVVFYKSSLTGWTIVNTTSYSPLLDQNRVLLRMTLIIFFGSIFITSIFSMFLSDNLTNPLKKLLIRMRLISKGNFERDLSIERDDEMGELGKGINEMSGNISKLLERVKKEEEDKRILEFELLQKQINPHFLYNTLNSIKWMAIVQKADGIRDMVSALGRLLMNITRLSAEQISLREEISLIDDYIFIQNIRYSGKLNVTYQIPDENLLENKIIRFTLQPIVENAIFHGIEPKKDAGNIKIGIIENTGNYEIFVEDDGVGIDSDDIKNMFNSTPKEKHRGLSGIGIKNVDDRLRLAYGSKFGLKIESELGIYTRVTIKIPKIPKDR